MTLRLLLVDDHAMLRQGLRRLFEGEEGFKVVGEAGDGRQAVDLAAQFSPDLILMDVSLPVLNGVEATREIKRAEPGIIVLALSRHMDRRYIGEMLRAGASGYVLKDGGLDELLQAIQTVRSGKTYLSPSIAGIVVSYFVRGQDEPTSAAYGSLTPREREILQLLSEGFAAKQIAHRLKVSVKTVDTHRYQVMRKLKLRGLADLTRFAIREGISSLDT